MKVAVRVDASAQIGTGHFMRCLTLADELTQRGAQIRFVSRYLPEYLASLLEVKGYELAMLDSAENDADLDELAHAHWLGCSQVQDATDSIKTLSDRAWDWLIVDHYALDYRWESMLRQTTHKILAIDDLADRKHDCDVLLDQNYYRDFGQRYLGLVPEHCVTLLGPSYVLLRPEFLHAKRRVRVRNGTVQRILVFFGGSDLANQTQIAVEALGLLNRPDIAADVVVGATNPCRNAIQTLCDGLPNVTFHCQVSNMARLIQNADLGIGAGGGAMWERCYLGLPAITVVFAINQERTTEDVADTGAIQYLGWADKLDSNDYARAIAEMIKKPQWVRQMGTAAQELVGQTNGGVAEVMFC